MTLLSQPARPYFRTPSISHDGTRIAFVYATDIWVVDTLGGEAQRMTAHPSGHISPRWSPDDRTLAFCSGRIGGGEVYLLPLDGGAVQRLTFSSAAMSPEAWSPDGKFLFVSSNREQQGSAFDRISRDGGTPIPWLGQPYERLEHLAVSPDGTRLAFNITRDIWWRRGPNPYGGSDLWIASNTLNAEDARQVGGDYAGLNSWPMWAPDSQGIYVVSDRDGVENIWFLALERHEARQISFFRDGRMLWPSISGNGQTIAFEREFGIWKLDVQSGEVAPVPIRVRADTKVTPVRTATYNRDLSELALAPDGKKIAFVVRGEVFLDFADKETDKERRQGPSFRVTNTPFREADLSWTPDSRSLLYTSDRHGDPEIYRYDVGKRTETRLTDSAGAKSLPLASPDGKWIAYARGDDEIRLIETASGVDRPFVRANIARGANYDWSPDSRWLAFCAQDERAFSNLYVQAVDADSARQISFLGNLVAYLPLWSPDGRFIIFTTGQYREELQIVRVDLQPRTPQFREDEFDKLFAEKDDRTGKPQANLDANEGSKANDERQLLKDEEQPTGDKQQAGNPELKTQNLKLNIIFEGIDRRLRLLTPPQMSAIAMSVGPDSRDLIFHARLAGRGNLWTLPLDEPRADQPPRQLTTSNTPKAAAQFTPDGKAFFHLDGGQVTIRKFPGGEATQLAVSADVLVDFHQEKQQIFVEAWRIMRDRFYDPSFRGLDWEAARSAFAPYAAGAQSYGELRTILNLMIGELRASHTGALWSAEFQDDGYLGLLFDRHEQAASGRLRVTAVLPEGPGALAGVRVGDELRAVDSRSVDGISLDTLLYRTIGRRVKLTLGGADGIEREVAVRPIGMNAYDRLRYDAWVAANEVYVHRVSNGRLGYVHIRSMDYTAYQRLLVDLDTEVHSREGVVIDVRFNRGGHISSFILDVLTRRSTLTHAFRGSTPADSSHMSGNRVLNKPTVLVINERSSSNTEMFAESYRRFGLGLVVGRPTAGAVIGTTERTLLDGTRLKVPQYRVSTLEGEDLEGKGREPDIDVALPPGATARGQDTQLDAAVQALLAQLDKAAE